MRIIYLLSLLALFYGIVDSFVYSCEEVKYKLVNTNFQVSTPYVCLILEARYSSLDQLNNIYVQAGNSKSSFTDILTYTNCIERPNDGSWKIVSDASFSLDCTQEFTLIFKSNYMGFDFPDPDMPLDPGVQVAFGGTQILVSPRTGIKLSWYYCHGDGNVTIYTGAGIGEADARYLMRSWRCADLPDWIISFDNVLTISLDSGNGMDMNVATLDVANFGTSFKPDDRITIMSSGRSDNLQNLHPERNVISLPFGADVAVTAVRTASFDSRYNGHVVVSGTAIDGATWTQTIRNESTSSAFGAAATVKVEYATNPVAPQDVWDSQDNFILDLTFNPYCRCALDKKFGMPDGWDSTEIWLDVVIILDTSEAMGDVALIDASSLVESFIGTVDADVLITDTTEKFYTRVGLIAMSDKAEVLYNLNMTKADKVNAQIKKGVTQIDVIAAFNAAQSMFDQGLISQPDRGFTRRVIYYMTDSDPKFDSRVLDGFKASQGVIIVNNFLMPGEPERAGLKDLASPGYFYYDIQYNYMSTIQLFCKANCFCRPDLDRVAYAGQSTDPAVQASGGCLSVASVGLPFSKARSNCAGLGGGLVASIHDDNKAGFVSGLMGDAKSDYYWIGYSKSDAGSWTWEDKPNPNAVSKCTYVDKNSKELSWGAGNCNVGFPSVCEFAPCSVGNNNCGM